MVLDSKTLTLPLAVALIAGLGACSSQAQTSAQTPTTSPGTPTPPTTHTKPPAGTTPPTTATATAPGPAPATEFRPPGDIPDNQVFVDFGVPGSNVHIKVPEGWARSTSNGVTTFTDHYNSIAIQVTPAAQKPTVASATSQDIPALRRTQPKFANPHVSQIQRQHGGAVLVTYDLDSAADPVTGKVVRDTAERYEFWNHGQEAILTLTGPTSADNVDPWRLVSDSLQWR